MKVKAYLHSDKESMYQLGYEAGLRDEQLEKFKYTGYEHEVIYEIDKEGWGTLVEIDGRKISSD